MHQVGQFPPEDRAQLNTTLWCLPPWRISNSQCGLDLPCRQWCCLTILGPGVTIFGSGLATPGSGKDVSIHGLDKFHPVIVVP